MIREKRKKKKEESEERKLTTYRPLFTDQSLLIIPLQWFADDNDEDAPGKTEQPTEHKLQRLREEGQIAKSQELVAALGLFLPALLLLFLAPSIVRTCVEMIRFFFLRATELDPTRDATIVGVFLIYFIKMVWPVLLVAVAAALFSNLVQTNGLLFTTKPITPDFSKVVPRLGQYFKRIFSVEGIFNLLKSVAKLLIIGGVAFVFIYSDFEKLLNMQKMDIWSGLTTVAAIAAKMLIVSAILLLILAIPDYMFQRWRFRERNKMTRYEIKEEMKMYEADPQIQSRIRSRFRELMKQSYTTSVPTADVVITNPTHLAVALKYDQKSMPGPMVVAIGADEMSAKIREIAQKYEVPLVENKPLAWALYRETDVGEIIPYEYWNTVALILSKVWYVNEERRRRMEVEKAAASA
jgi:flagellar biosynthetic protein FlhB